MGSDWGHGCGGARVVKSAIVYRNGDKEGITVYGVIEASLTEDWVCFTKTDGNTAYFVRGEVDYFEIG